MNYTKKATDFISKNSLLVATGLLVFAFLFSRLPFFLWFSLPHYCFDTLSYFNEARLYTEGKIPDSGFLPIGYPLFLYFTKNLSAKSIILIQNLLLFSVMLYFIVITDKHYKKLSILLSLALCVTVLSSKTISYDVSFQTETLYRTAVIFVTALFINAINTKKILPWIILSISFIFPPLIRSNGIFIYFLLFFVLIFFMFNKKEYKFKHYLILLLPFVLLHFAWATYNYKVSDVFLPGNPLRYNHVVNRDINKSEKTKSNFIVKKIKLTARQFAEVAIREHNFYYYNIPGFYNSLYVKKNRGSNYFLRNAPWGKIKFDDTLLRMTYKEYYDTVPTPEISKNIAYCNIDERIEGIPKKQKISHPWLFLYHNYHLFHNVFFRNVVWVLLLFVIFGSSFFKLIKSKFKDKGAFIVCSIALIQIFSALFAATHSRFVSRYIEVTSFIYYILPVFYIYYSDRCQKIYKKVKLCFQEKQ